MLLDEWQRGLQNCIIQPLADAQLIENTLQSTHMNKDVQLGIYRFAYSARLNEALKSNYPALHQLLGDIEFECLANVYLETYPPIHASIRWYGETLSLFMATTAPYQTLPVMAELAQFEWALRHTIDAGDVERVSLEHMAAIAPEHWGDLHFAPHPSASLLTLTWNAPPLWKALVNHEEAPLPKIQATSWLTYRQIDSVSGWRSMDAIECAAFTVLQQQGSFGDICAALAALLGDENKAAMTSAKLLHVWITQGLIAFADRRQ